MRKLFLIIVYLFACVLSINARYTVHSVTPGVLIENGGKQSKVQTGMVVKPSDHLIIPKGGKVEIYNDLDKRIYTSVSDGKMTLTRLMIDARSTASDNRGNVASRLRFGKKSASSSNDRLYVEKGMVKRSLGIFDPEGEKISANPSLIARFIASRLSDSGDNLCDTMPIAAEHSVPEEGGMEFSVRNTLDFPVYFNIVKIGKSNGNRAVRISEVGQPTGFYVLLPNQTIERGHFNTLAEDELHLMVMTHCQFDIDEMIEELGKALNGPVCENGSFDNLPIYLMKL